MDRGAAAPAASCAVFIGSSRRGQNRGEVRGSPEGPADGGRTVDLIPPGGLPRIPYSLPPISVDEFAQRQTCSQDMMAIQRIWKGVALDYEACSRGPPQVLSGLDLCRAAVEG
jgi:hypothetical protein